MASPQSVVEHTIFTCIVLRFGSNGLFIRHYYMFAFLCDSSSLSAVLFDPSVSHLALICYSYWYLNVFPDLSTHFSSEAVLSINRALSLFLS